MRGIGGESVRLIEFDGCIKRVLFTDAFVCAWSFVCLFHNVPIAVIRSDNRSINSKLGAFCCTVFLGFLNLCNTHGHYAATDSANESHWIHIELVPSIGSIQLGAHAGPLSWLWCSHCDVVCGVQSTTAHLTEHCRSDIGFSYCKQTQSLDDDSQPLISIRLSTDHRGITTIRRSARSITRWLGDDDWNGRLFSKKFDQRASWLEWVKWRKLPRATLRANRSAIRTSEPDSANQSRSVCCKRGFQSKFSLYANLFLSLWERRIRFFCSRQIQNKPSS